MENRIESSISKFHMQDIYEGAILGFSGGADSSLLLYFLKDRVKNLLCVHVNHMIRGEEADRDEAFAKAVCEKYGVKIKTVKIDIPKLAREEKKGIEECARDARYNLFYEILKENPEYKCIVTAHNLDDSVETVIFNLARGTGPSGLTGIKPVKQSVMRPLIEVSKQDVINYCHEKGIEYITDSTNEDTAYTRNHVRKNVIPKLKRINPELYSAVFRMGDILRQDNEYFENQIYKIVKENQIKDKIDINLLNSLDISLATRLLRHVSGRALDYSSLTACVSLAKKEEVGALINLPSGLSFKIERGYVHFIKTQMLEKADFYTELNIGLNEISEVDKIIALNTDKIPVGYKEEFKISLKAEKINARLYTRPKRDGDTIKQGKMTKKIKKLFVEKQIPSHLRDKLPLILLENEIIAVPGVAVSDGFSGNDFKIIIYKRENEND